MSSCRQVLLFRLHGRRAAFPFRTPIPIPHAASHLPRHDGEESTQASRLSQIRGHPPVQIHALGPGTLRRHGCKLLLCGVCRCVGVGVGDLGWADDEGV